LNIELFDEDATLKLAGRLFKCLIPGVVVHLQGTLGAGKTTFVRGCLRAAGHAGAVKSPTYTLVEEYRIGELLLYHFDLYRLADPEELEWMGIRDYLIPEAICFIEWPEKGGSLLPRPDIEVRLTPVGTRRRLTLSPLSESGIALLEGLSISE